MLSLFPPGSALDPDGMLTIAGCRAEHVHVGSQILDLEPFAQSVAPVAARLVVRRETLADLLARDV
jgi:hypothetical protein